MASAWLFQDPTDPHAHAIVAAQLGADAEQGNATGFL